MELNCRFGEDACLIDPLAKEIPKTLTETSLDLFFDLRDVRLDPCHVSGDVGCKAQDIGGGFFSSVAPRSVELGKNLFQERRHALPQRLFRFFAGSRS